MKEILTKGEKTKRAIVQASIRLFSKKGYAPTSFQDIADDCGLSQTAVLFHFSNKKNLIRDAIYFVVESNHRVVSAGLDPKANARDRLKKHFEMNLQWAVKKPSEAQLILLLYYMAAQNKVFCQMYRQMRTHASRRIEEYLYEAQREGTVSAKLKPHPISLLLHDTLLGGILNFLATRQPKSNVKDLHKQWDDYFQKILKL